MTKLIGLSGPARSGKDSVGKFIKQFTAAELYSFALPIKKAIKTAFGLTEAHVNGHLKEKPLQEYDGKSPRYLMQTFGTEFGREMVCGDVWIRRAHVQLMNCKHNLFVVTDIRFDNEADWIRSLGGEIWHIEREEKEEVRAHVSEAGVTRHSTDVILQNNGTLNELRTAVIKALNNT